MKKVLPFLLISILLAGLIAPFASSFPDGLERVAEKLGFDHFTAEDPALKSPLPDYTVPFFGDSSISTSASGIVGTLLCFFLPFSLYLIRKK